MLWIILIVLLVCFIVTLLAWKISNHILVPEPYSLMPEFKIVAVSETSVTLPLPPNQKQFANTKRLGHYSLLYENGYGSLGDIVAEDTTIERKFTLLSGKMPEAGEPARLDQFVFRSDPSERDLAFETINLKGEEGDIHAWWLEPENPDTSGTAILMAHGRRRGQLCETLRVLPALANAGYAVLACSYRNHDKSSDSSDGFYHYGLTEWHDVEQGLKFLQDKGYKKIVLYGFSMGGAVMLELYEALVRRKDSEHIKGIILDSPLLDPRRVFYHTAEKMGILGAKQLTNFGMWLASKRTGIDWLELNQPVDAPYLELPILLLHGVQDSTIPIALADEFAKAAPNIVYKRLENTEHVEPWNQDPKAYETWVLEFLESNTN